MDEAAKLAAAEADAAKAAEGKKDEGYRTQEEFDKVLATKLAKDREKLKAENEAIVKKAIADAQAEAQRQAKLSEDERRKEADAQRDTEYQELKSQNAILTNSATATTILEERGIPLSLLEYVVDTDAEKTKSNIDKFDTAFGNAVQVAVEKKLAGKTPADTSGKAPAPTQYGGATVL